MDEIWKANHMRGVYMESLRVIETRKERVTRRRPAGTIADSSGADNL